MKYKKWLVFVSILNLNPACYFPGRFCASRGDRRRQPSPARRGRILKQDNTTSTRIIVLLYIISNEIISLNNHWQYWVLSISQPTSRNILGRSIDTVTFSFSCVLNFNTFVNSSMFIINLSKRLSIFGWSRICYTFSLCIITFLNYVTC